MNGIAVREGRDEAKAVLDRRLADIALELGQVRGLVVGDLLGLERHGVLEREGSRKLRVG